MQIGNPPLANVLHELIEQGVERLIVLPMYPQYSATTTASATDTLFQALLKERRVPALRIVPPYYEHPAYIEAMAALRRFSERLARGGRFRATMLPTAEGLSLGVKVR